MNLFKNKISIKAFITIISVVIISSCSSKTKEKELPSYFCNENLERYFSGNDSLPVININPSDSFGVIRKSIDSLYLGQEYIPEFKFPVYFSENYDSALIRTSFFDYYPDGFETPIGCRYKKNVFEILLASDNKLLVEGESFEIDSLENIIPKFISNYGKDPNYSSNPSIASIVLQRDTIINSKTYYNVISSIIDGYLSILNLESKNRYKKTFCELNTAESDTISNIVPFNFYIEYPETNPYYLNPYEPSDLDFLDDSLLDKFLRNEY